MFKILILRLFAPIGVSLRSCGYSWQGVEPITLHWYWDTTHADKKISIYIHQITNKGLI
jgi:hypothetical protein